jgi:organic hydroperoxide reductase OsmC/OhrA
MLTYTTTVAWTGGHTGRLACGNGHEAAFSAPPALQGMAGVLTPEDAFVAAVNTCFQMMFLWAAERFKLGLVSYRCTAEGYVKEFLDQTGMFERVVLRPEIVVSAADERRVRIALQAARRYSLIAESVKSEIVVEPTIVIQKPAENGA